MSSQAALIAAPEPKRIADVNPLRVFFIVFLFYLQAGIVTIFAMGNTVIGRQAASALILAVIVFSPLLRRYNFSLRSPVDLFPIIYLVLVILVSYNSNNRVFNYGWDNWLTYSYVFIPLLIYYALWALSVSFADIVVALIIIGSLAAATVAFDSVIRLPVLDMIERYANESGTRRVTFLKNECVLSFLFMLASIYTQKRWIKNIALYAIPMVVVFYVLVFLFESRIALAAMLIAAVLFLATRGIRTIRQLLMLTVVGLVGAPALYFILDRFIAPLLTQSLENYIVNNNVDTRLESAQYFWPFFKQTGGLGFGIMTVNLDVSNFQVLGLKQSYGVADLGMLGGMYEFGYFGLFMVVSATALMIFNFFRLGWSRSHPQHDQMLMLGCFILAFVLQPVPMDFFALVWTVTLGGTLWYAMRRARFEQRVILRAQHMAASLEAIMPAQSSQGLRSGTSTSPV